MAGLDRASMTRLCSTGCVGEADPAILVPGIPGTKSIHLLWPQARVRNISCSGPACHVMFVMFGLEECLCLRQKPPSIQPFDLDVNIEIGTSTTTVSRYPATAWMPALEHNGVHCFVILTIIIFFPIETKVYEPVKNGWEDWSTYSRIEERTLMRRTWV